MIKRFLARTTDTIKKAISSTRIPSGDVTLTPQKQEEYKLEEVTRLEMQKNYDQAQESKKNDPSW
jgi:hypothetical protein